MSDLDLAAQLHHRVARQVQVFGRAVALWCMKANSFSRQGIMPAPGWA
jgi:hypothetical protein